MTILYHDKGVNQNQTVHILEFEKLFYTKRIGIIL